MPGLTATPHGLPASTHDGEDAVVLDAHLAARSAEPGLRLILAPRHPRRAGDIAALAQARGLSVARRSMGEPPEADVYIADTLGEMPLFYALAGRVFIGGTLTDRGGHTPYEPAAYGAALIHGPDLRNFRAPFARLSAADAALPAGDAQTLAAALAQLRGAAQTAMGARARATLRPEADAETLTNALARQLPPAPRA